jgi:hypothetical protein
MRRFALLSVLLWSALPALAHQGPPFPILDNQRTGPYVASVWTDPDVGTGTFFVILEPPEGRRLPTRTRVRIGLQPVSKRLGEVIYEAKPQKENAARYFTTAPLDKEERWRVRVLLNGSEGGGELKAEVEATPDGTLGPIGALIYLVPFLGVGFLWLKAVLKRREKPVAPPEEPLEKPR